jgi:hypothetical protein
MENYYRKEREKYFPRNMILIKVKNSFLPPLLFSHGGVSLALRKITRMSAVNNNLFKFLAGLRGENRESFVF